MNGGMGGGMGKMGKTNVVQAEMLRRDAAP